MEFSVYEQSMQKQEIVDLISELALNGDSYELSKGSSIPNKFFSDLGLFTNDGIIVLNGTHFIHVARK